LNQGKINRLTLRFLIVGLGGAVAIYLLAPPPPAENSLLNDPRARRMYVRQLAMYGGKGNVVAAEIMEWLDALWHGRNLAYTVAVLTLAGTWTFRFAASLPAKVEPVADPAAPPDDPGRQSGQPVNMD
jgi:hypothetical protein